MTELLNVDKHVKQQNRKSCMSEGASFTASLLRGCTFSPQTFTQTQLKEHLPMKDFLPVFMSS